MAFFSQLFAIVSPVFLCAAVGFLWVRSGRPWDSKNFGDLIMRVGTPALVFSTLSDLKLDTQLIPIMAAALAVAILFCMALGWVFLRLLAWDIRAFLPSLMLPNVGNMGLPVCYFAFGERGLALAIICMVVYMVVQLTLGTMIGGRRSQIKQSIQLLALFALVLAASLYFPLTNSQPPKWLANSTELIGSFTVPLMLIGLGASVAQIQLRNFSQVFTLAMARFLIGLAAVWLAILVMPGLDPLLRSVLLIQMTMPVAVYNFVFAQMYDRKPAEVASLVLVSTLMSMVTLPLMLFYVLG